MSFEADAIEATEDIIDALGGSITYTPTGGSAVTLNGVLDRRSFEVENDDGSSVIFSARVTVATSSLPAGYAEGDAVLADGTNFHVRTFLDEGLGATELRLQRA